MEILGNIIIILGIIFMLFGVIGIFRYQNFFVRILIASKIDTVGALTVVIGLAVKHGFSFFSLRVVLLLVLMFIINPMVTHIIARSAYESGQNIDGSVDDIEEGNE
ncbi:MAG: monovalent cation/H(+) antiporter subunit G [Lachnospiraceae bacterium]|nr:monovalent cation/H(+) antiporter subunit G [Lachnospiraceae bacterium]